MDDKDRETLSKLTKSIKQLPDRLRKELFRSRLQMGGEEFRGPIGRRGDTGEPGGKGPEGPRGFTGERGGDGPPGAAGPGSGPRSGPSGGGRFWEAYLVRYLAGTVVGAIGVVALVFEAPLFSGSDLPKQTVDALFNADGLASLLILFIALGFAFSYIASAPVYTLHLYRCLLFTKESDRIKWSGAGIGFLGLSFLVTICGVLIGVFSPSNSLSFTAAILLLVILVGLGLFPFLKSIPNQSAIKDFYDSLASGRARASRTEDPEFSPVEAGEIAALQEFIESYRHLREHGNAYLIVILNILLTCVLSVAETIQQVGVIICLWVLPATMGWFIATRLESTIRT